MCHNVGQEGKSFPPFRTPIVDNFSGAPRNTLQDNAPRKSKLFACVMKHLSGEFYIFRHPHLAIPFTFITFAKDYKNNRTDNPMKKSILLLFAAFATLVASAQTKVEIDGIWYNLVSKAKQAEVTFKGSSYDEYSNEYSGSITIPATVTHEGVSYSVTSIGSYAFYDCRNLTAITLPEGVTSIGDKAFYYCTCLTAITIPEGVTSIGSSAFYGCSSLTTITIPEGVTSIGSHAFYGCSSLASITIPKSVTSIGDSAFCGCSSLTSITIPKGVTYIGDSAFFGCSGLTSIAIPEGVTSIENDTFSYCRSLTSITIPKSVTSIGVSVFEGCSSLTNITIHATVPPTFEYASYDFDESACTLCVPLGYAAAYQAAYQWKDFLIVEGAGGTEGLLASKNYRVKNVSTGLYLQVSGNNTNMTLQDKAEGVELMQVFQFEDAGEGMYYIKAADSDNNYYAHASGWNFNATTNADNKTPFTIALVEGETEVYTLHQSVSNHTGMAGTDASTAGAAIYCNKNVNNNGKWAFEALTEEENAAYVAALTATAKAALDAAIARGESVLANRSAVLTADEVAAISAAVQAAKEGKDTAAEVAALKALSDAITAAVDAAIYVHSIDDLSNEVCYAVATEERGAWYAQEANLTSTTKANIAVDITDAKQQFAFVQSPTTNACYLYSVGEEKFVKVEDNYTALTETPVHTISFLEGTRSTAFPWVVAFNADGVQKQLGVSNGYDYGVITSWNNLNDMGNTVRIEKVAAFDASAALALIDSLETSIEKAITAAKVLLNRFMIYPPVIPKHYIKFFVRIIFIQIFI